MNTWRLSSAGKNLIENIFRNHKNVLEQLPEEYARVFEESLPKSSSPVKIKIDGENTCHTYVDHLEEDVYVQNLTKRAEMVNAFLSDKDISQYYKEVVLLIYFDGLSVSEVASIYKASERTVRRWRQKALEIFALKYVGPFIGEV